MARTLYLVRHGRTMFNDKRIIQGWCDSPLTVEGVEQARRLKAYFRHEGIAFDHVYASTLGRARQTAELASDLPCVCVDGLREWFFGAYEAKRIELMPPRPWGDFFCQFGGESQDAVRERMSATLTDIMSRPGHECVLAVSSGSSCREFFARWVSDADVYRAGVAGNCSIMRFTFDGAAFTFEDLIDADQQQRALES